MTTPTADIHAFLRRYEQATHELDRLGELFEPSFVSGSPRGTSVVTREQLVAASDARGKAMEAFGIEGSRLTDIDVRWLGRSYCLATTVWVLTFSPTDREPVTIDVLSDFLLQVTDDEVSIVAYLARQDLAAVLAEAGLTG